jgi:hypothetical protein
VNPLLLAPVLEIGKSLIERFFPNEEERRKAEADFLKLAMDGELKQVVAQLEINAREAQHPSLWVAGWRPGFGWVGVLAFAYATIGAPVLTFFAKKNGWPTPPELNMDLLWVVVTGMLGIGGLRTFEKTKKVSK